MMLLIRCHFVAASVEARTVALFGKLGVQTFLYAALVQIVTIDRMVSAYLLVECDAIAPHSSAGMRKDMGNTDIYRQYFSRYSRAHASSMLY
ncbi:MAG TPA: hypothetical protein VFW00_01700 [Rhodocyclaceae bacterium]|nr:hypothetical protein [Rhodocyclaceae bacterium]